MSFVLFFSQRLGHDLPGQCFSRIRSQETQHLTADMLGWVILKSGGTGGSGRFPTRGTYASFLCLWNVNDEFQKSLERRGIVVFVNHGFQLRHPLANLPEALGRQ